MSAGTEVDVQIELDDAPREVEVPADLADALKKNPAAGEAFVRLSYSNKKRHVLAIEGARAPRPVTVESTRSSPNCRLGRSRDVG